VYSNQQQMYVLWHRGALDGTEALLSGVQQSHKQVEKAEFFHTASTRQLHFLLRHATHQIFQRYSHSQYCSRIISLPCLFHNLPVPSLYIGSNPAISPI